jgi:hypothetical protein
MSEPIATVEDVRSAYVMCDEDEIAFDRWLALVKADAWAECAKEILQTREWHGGNQKYFPRNPYRGVGDE